LASHLLLLHSLKRLCALLGRFKSTFLGLATRIVRRHSTETGRFISPFDTGPSRNPSEVVNVNRQVSIFLRRHPLRSTQPAPGVHSLRTDLARDSLHTRPILSLTKLSLPHLSLLNFCYCLRGVHILLCSRSSGKQSLLSKSKTMESHSTSV